MAYSSNSRGCGTCGGGTAKPPAPAPPTYDPCGGGLAMTAPRREASCGCGGGGGSGCTCNQRPVAVPTRNYNAKDCPTFAVSCETKQALRDCAKVALCDFLRCLSETVCPDGRFDLERLQKNERLRGDLINCVGQLACSFMHCVPEALCPEPCAPEAPVDCLPCGYAVEVLS
jgi:hypothetical protein